MDGHSLPGKYSQTALMRAEKTISGIMMIITTCSTGPERESERERGERERQRERAREERETERERARERERERVSKQEELQSDSCNLEFLFVLSNFRHYSYVASTFVSVMSSI